MQTYGNSAASTGLKAGYIMEPPPNVIGTQYSRCRLILQQGKEEEAYTMERQQRDEEGEAVV